jgi:Tfp pilus assembly protein PilN
MGVQFNLLPDVKLEFEKQKRTKRLVYTIAILISGGAVCLLIICFVFVNLGQKKSLDDAQKDIKKYSNDISKIPDIEKVLTVQNQLKSLPNLHSQKHISSRIFTYLPKITPQKVFIGQTTIDYTANTISLTGTTDTLENVNAFVDTLKFTNYKATKGDDQKEKPAFSGVTLSSSARTDKGASYSIKMSFDPELFSNDDKNVVLVVPNKITTRSVTEAPALFNGDTGKSSTDQGSQ